MLTPTDRARPTRGWQYAEHAVPSLAGTRSDGSPFLRIPVSARLTVGPVSTEESPIVESDGSAQKDHHARGGADEIDCKTGPK
jgi:hypothetical protein